MFVGLNSAKLRIGIFFGVVSAEYFLMSVINYNPLISPDVRQIHIIVQITSWYSPERIYWCRWLVTIQHLEGFTLALIHFSYNGIGRFREIRTPIVQLWRMLFFQLN